MDSFFQRLMNAKNKQWRKHLKKQMMHTKLKFRFWKSNIKNIYRFL